MINLEIPKKFKPLATQANQVAKEVFRPISRKYDVAEHEYPKELDMLAALIDGLNVGSDLGGAGAAGVRRDDSADSGENRNGSNLSTVLGIIELCWGDVGLLLSMPRQGLGNSAIASVATEEQLEKYGGKWAAMAITEPEAGSDSAAIRTTAELDGDEYVLNGEKIFVTSGDRADLIVVWASLDRSLGRAAIKSFIVERDNPGLKLDRLEHKLGIRASDTANFTLQDCRVPKEALLGDPEVKQKGFAGVMETFDNTRPLVALPGDGGRLRGGLAADPAGGLDGGQLEAELAAGLDGQGQGRPHRRRRDAGLRRALRQRRLRRERPAREVGARRQDPRHLRGDPADPAADRGEAVARQELV